MRTRPAVRTSLRSGRLLFTAILLAVTPLLSVDAAWLAAGEQERLLQQFDFWDNRDWHWYQEHIPFIDTPDKSLDEVYYYRWQLVTKHLRYVDAERGYIATEFNDTPFYAGAYGAIVAPAGQQLWEMQWLRDRRYAQDYIRTYLYNSRSRPYRYATWLVESARSLLAIHPDRSFLDEVVPELEKHVRHYEDSQFDKERGLYWSVPVWEATEHTIAGLRTAESYHGGDGYRPVLNSYMYANAAGARRAA